MFASLKDKKRRLSQKALVKVGAKFDAITDPEFEEAQCEFEEWSLRVEAVYKRCKEYSESLKGSSLNVFPRT
jgi:hypothetical protein